MNKRINFNIKDRKVLYGILCIVLISVFTLTIAYAALNAVLTISGNAQVTASNWDIHMENPKVTNGSATTTVPSINGNNLTFSTTLNMPGDYYEFTVDVVNGGSIEAMIDSVVKTPELTTAQAKFLKYEITYQNGESINTKQNIAAGATTPIKVRLEYRNDLSASDLPTTADTLSLSLTLVYVQSDGTGSDVKDNGVYDPFKIGNEKCFGSECFYVIGTEGDNVKLLAKYNLQVGNVCTSLSSCTPIENPTGLQESTMIGYPPDGSYPRYGTTVFSSATQKGTNYSDYTGSIVEGYVNAYKIKLETNFGVPVIEARLITKDELESNDIGCSSTDNTCSGAPSFIYETSYWSGSASSTRYVWRVHGDGNFGDYYYSYAHSLGVRPVIIISKSNF